MGTFRGVELADVELAGERLILRRWQPDDAAAVQEIMRDLSLFAFLPLPDPYTADKAHGFVTISGHEGRDQGTGVGSAVIERSSGRVVGSAAVRFDKDGEIGYWIAPAARGNGYATEATRVLRDWAFGIGVERLRLLSDVRNLASARVALAAGFRFEGVGRGPLPGPDTPANSPTHHDLARFGMLADDAREAVAPAFAPLPPDGLTDDVLTLRLIRAEDGSAFHDAADELHRSWGFTAEGSTPAADLRLAMHAGLQSLVGPHLRLCMIDRASGSYAGDVMLRVAGPPGCALIGYAVHPDFRGRGFTTRALRIIVPWAFDVANLARLELGAKVMNVASQRAAANAGFEPDGLRKARLRNPDGTFSDEVCFALVNPRYR